MDGPIDIQEFLAGLPEEFGLVYEWSQLLGSGGQGFAMLGMQKKLRRPVVLKFLLRRGEQAERRFLAEARILSRIRNPHVVRLYDFGHVSGSLYLVLEYSAGRTLHARLAAGLLPLEEIVGIAKDVALGLTSIHGEGIIHRDLKPDNLWCAENGRTKILDFGIARIEEGESLTAAGSFMGTPAYAAPEQFTGEPVDARADLYSLGVVLYELVTGINPFIGPTMAVTMSQQLSLVIDSVPRSRIQLSANLEDLIVTLLNKSASLRIPDAVTLLERLERDFPGRSDTRVVLPPPDLEESFEMRYTKSSLLDPPADPLQVTPPSNRAVPRSPDPLPVTLTGIRNRAPWLWLLTGLALVLGGILSIVARSGPVSPVSSSATAHLPSAIAGEQVAATHALIDRIKAAMANHIRMSTQFQSATGSFDVSRLSQLDAKVSTEFLQLMKTVTDHRTRLESGGEDETRSARDLCLVTAVEGWQAAIYFRLITLKTITGGEIPVDFPTPELAPAFRAIPRQNGADSLFKVKRLLLRTIETARRCEEQGNPPETFAALVAVIGEVGRLLETTRWREESWSTMSREIEHFERALTSAGDISLSRLVWLGWSHGNGAQTVAQLDAVSRDVLAVLEQLEKRGRISPSQSAALREAACESKK